MKKGYLSQYFDGSAAKILKPVDAEPIKSNQHELGTSKEMRSAFLGDFDRKGFSPVSFGSAMNKNPCRQLGQPVTMILEQKNQKEVQKGGSITNQMRLLR